MERSFPDLSRPAPQAANRGPRCPGRMHPETPRMDLRGLTSMTIVLSFCANKPHNGGAYRLR